MTALHPKKQEDVTISLIQAFFTHITHRAYFVFTKKDIAHELERTSF